MKEKQILCAASLALALLLCACQTPAETGDAASGTDIPLTETGGEGEVGGEISEEAESHLPPAPPVCETVFTETEGFPYPFEEGVLRDEEGHMALPYSGLAVRYDACLGFNPDGTCNGTTGIQPDIPIQNGETALDACLAAIAIYEEAN